MVAAPCYVWTRPLLGQLKRFQLESICVGRQIEICHKTNEFVEAIMQNDERVLNSTELVLYKAAYKSLYDQDPPEQQTSPDDSIQRSELLSTFKDGSSSSTPSLNKEDPSNSGLDNTLLPPSDKEGIKSRVPIVSPTSTSKGSSSSSPTSSTNNVLVEEMSRFNVMVQERITGLTTVMDRFAIKQEQINSMFHSNALVMNDKFDQLSGNIEKLVKEEFYKSPLVREVSEMRNHLEEGLVFLHSLQQDVRSLGTRVSVLENNAPLRLPKLVPFDNTQSGYSQKVEDSIVYDSIDAADDSRVTLRKKRSSSLSEEDCSFKGYGPEHCEQTDMVGNVFTPDIEEKKSGQDLNSNIPVGVKNDDYDKLVSLYNEVHYS